MNKTKVISKIQSELLPTLFNYVVPFIDKKIKIIKKEQGKKVNKLEDIINNQKPKIDFKDIKELESLILRNLNENIKINKSIGIGKSDLSYSLNLRRQKNNNEKNREYAVSIKYEESETKEKLKISIKKAEKEVYSAEIVNKKDLKDKVVPYSIKISYEDNYAEERLSITYRQQLKQYMRQHIGDKEDMTNRVPLKWLNILPETIMGGVLGFTYLGENFMGRRADLVGKTARMVDIHESIHTPDEYETRVLTSWIMEKVRGKYVK